jgi:hypothetical protein
MDETTLIRPGIEKHIFHIYDSTLPLRFTPCSLQQKLLVYVRSHEDENFSVPYNT